MARKKQDELEKKLAKAERAGGMSSGELVSLMNDDLLVDRYTKHLNKIFFKYHDPFVKAKYQAWLATSDPNSRSSFFRRMRLDEEAREARQAEARERGQPRPQNVGTQVEDATGSQVVQHEGE